MVRKLVAATVSAALCTASLVPGIAAAQEYRFSNDAPRGASATLNLRVPFGPNQRQRTSYGLTLGYGQTVAPGIDGRTSTRAINVADFRFNTRGELRQARVAAFDLANLDRSQRRMNLTGEGNTMWIVVGLVAAGVAICLLADCFDGDDDDSSSN